MKLLKINILILFIFIYSNIIMGESTKTQKVINQSEKFSIELYLPSYYPEELRHPRKFFSGREIEIKGNFAQYPFKSLVIISNTKSIKAEVTSKVKERNNSIIVELPKELETADYILQLTSDNGDIFNLPIRIEGFSQQEKFFNQRALPATGPVGSIVHLNCGSCYWEMVLGGSVNNPEKAALVGRTFGYNLVRTESGWESFQKDYINFVTDSSKRNDVSYIEYHGDPKIIFGDEDRFYVSALVRIYSNDSNKFLAIGGGLYRNMTNTMNGLLKVTRIQDVPEYYYLPPSQYLLFDYEKLAVDHNANSNYYGSVYVITWHAIYSNLFSGPALYISRDDGEAFVQKELDYLDRIPGWWEATPNSSLTIGIDGKLYSVFEFRKRVAPPFLYDVVIIRSDDGGETYNLLNFGTTLFRSVARVSNLSNRAWNIYASPELAVDKSGGNHNGRIYLVWSSPKEIITNDTNFESSSYGKDFDIYISHSDNNAENWSVPIRVNDDNSGGDQFFHSISVDREGGVHIAFVDRRENPNLGQFDVYYTVSKDGGETFSPNVRVNDTHVPISLGGRVIGDYLDMVVAYPEKVYIGYPCASEEQYPQYTPSDACITIISHKCGDLDSEGHVNVRDIIFLVNYIFKGGPASSPLCSGDVNASGSNPNLTDLIYMANYVFREGPAPQNSGVCCR